MKEPAEGRLTPERLMKMAWSYAPPIMIGAAVEQGLFDALAQSPKNVEELSAATRCSPRGVRILANALAGLELLTKDAADRYGLAPEAAAFLVRGKPSFQGGLFRHTGDLIGRWLSLAEVVKSGVPPQRVNEEKSGAEFFVSFVDALFPMNYPAAQALAASFHLDARKEDFHVLDLAAGSGVWGIAVAQASPHVRVTAVDFEQVLPVTRRSVERHGLTGRFRFVAGDILTADLGSGHDLAIMGHILHSEGAERSRALLRHAGSALKPGGTVAIAEFLVNRERTGPPQGLIFAVNMLVNTEKGDTFSFEEISEWLREAGFENPRTLDVPGPSPLILAQKRGL